MFNEEIPGSVITNIPINPTKTAIHLNIPTFSFNKKIENIVVKIGAAKDMLTTVANGKLRAIKLQLKQLILKNILRSPALLVK